MQSPIVEELPSDMIVSPMPNEFSVPFNPIDDLGPIEPTPFIPPEEFMPPPDAPIENPYFPIFDPPVSEKPEPPPSIGGPSLDPGAGPVDPFDPIYQPPIEPPVGPIPTPPPGYRPPPSYGGPVPPPPGYEPTLPPVKPTPPPPPPPPPPGGGPIVVEEKRPYYERPTSFESGVPAFKLPSGLSIDSFGRAPGKYGQPEPTPMPPKPPTPVFPPKPPPPIFVPPKDPPFRPGDPIFFQQPENPRDDMSYLFSEPLEKKFGGRLNKGIMRLPQSQQGDIMTTRVFQNAFKPRR
tara:strand:- start:183 stop:1058 length:876 start_codon:yes stop_codon:yes gene_type:complete